VAVQLASPHDNLPEGPDAYELRRLGPADERELRRFLAHDVAQNAYFLGQLARGALADDTIAGTIIGVTLAPATALVGAACLGSNLVLGHTFPAACFPDLMRAADETGWLMRVIVGPDALVAELMLSHDRVVQPVALERGAQILFEVDRRHLARDARSAELRPAQLHELDQVLQADLLMVTEELGFDPFSADFEGYRRGWHRRILEWRAWVVGPLTGPIRFKVDQATVSPDVVQLAGVWTRPEARGQGLARRALGEMCDMLLREVPRVCLYVHATNTPAVRLYRSLGFYEVGRVRSVWLAAP